MSEETLRQAIRDAYRSDEAGCVARLLDELSRQPDRRAAVAERAAELVQGVRRQRRHASGVDHLMHEFSLSSQEGIALMCLAEALLRIPDSATVDRLIRDKIGHGDWAAHLGHSPSLFVNAATWGLLLTGKLVATHSQHLLGGALSRLLARGGEPLIRKSVDYAMRLLGQQFVMGERIETALQRAASMAARGYSHSFDMLGEAALTAADAERYHAAYTAAIHAIGQASNGRGAVAGPGISIKLSALHPRYTCSQRERVEQELLPRLKSLLLLARDYDIGLNIDAEEADRLELSLDLLTALAGDPELAGWQGLGFVVQAYQKRCPALIDYLVELARRTRRRLMLRLVKGAYWDSEIKRAQVDGLADYPVYTRKEHTDLAYLACAARLLAAPDAIYPQFATHNAQTLARIERMAADAGVDDYEFQCLHGMGEALYDHVVGTRPAGRLCRIYAPVGSHDTLLPYLVRRLLENGANSSFVNRIVDPQVPLAALIEDPLDSVAHHGGQRHPAIPLPDELYAPARRNSAGCDLSDENQRAPLAAALARLAPRCWSAEPLVAGAPTVNAPSSTVSNPARRSELVGRVCAATPAQIEQALAQAAAVAAEWQQTPPAQRARLLDASAEALAAARDELVSLGIREAGKTWGNALAEVREAVDFCRYYAAELRAGRLPTAAPPPGPAVCISPWNFPLAIFIGEVSAALAAGSPVLAKPAEQTPLIAHLAVQLLHRAGIPPAVLQFLPGDGDSVGAQLVADSRVRSVVFTGSTEVARHINRSLAARSGVRLIAETGGQNAMIVDSSALPEQVVQDVLSSGFDSAGQRCSALRVLCLQHEIADSTLALLKAALRELRIGDPALFSTDIGPVIDAEAQSRLHAHIEEMRSRGCPVAQLPLPAACAEGNFVAPTLIEIERLSQLSGEVFGPVVHVLRFSAARLPQLVEEINATGYGLTLGLHSRIDETIATVVAGARVGNLYVNRNMVGAVVGVQPFGGEGLSGTGPKAGGPLYLPRLAGSPRLDAAALGIAGAPTAALAALHAWALANGYRELAARCAEDAAASLLGGELALPGPTGERNTLRFAPRGRLFCLGATLAERLRQLAAVLATGNRAALSATGEHRELLRQLPPEVAAEIELRAPDVLAGLAGVLAADSPDLRQQLAAVEGPLLALHAPSQPDGRYPLQRMLVERVLSVNTAAAGGNTTLMTLAA